jgi:hypothetical protein
VTSAKGPIKISNNRNLRKNLDEFIVGKQIDSSKRMRNKTVVAEQAKEVEYPRQTPDRKRKKQGDGGRS